jgi:hypothetical protein
MLPEDDADPRQRVGVRRRPRAMRNARIRAMSTPQVAPGRVVWIASYPKSGNTWVRFMTGNLLFGRQESAASLNALIPDVHEMGPVADRELPAPLLKTHFAFSAALPHAPRTAAAIYVVRDPADVLVSNYFYSQRSQRGTGAAPGDFDRYVDSFIEHRGDPRWTQLGMGSWEDNVRSWIARTEFPVLRLRYEDLIDDPAAGCRAIARLLRPDSAQHEILTAVDNASFERMRQIERADILAQRVGIFYKPYLQPAFDAGIRFMRRGVVGDGRARLSEAQRGRLRSAFSGLLEELGYA